MANSPTILIADDDALLRELIEHKLLTWGYKVASVADGEAAYEVIRDKQPAMVLLDVMMPRLDGFALLRKLKREGLLEHTHVIMLTARNSESDVVSAFRWGAADYLNKPFSSGELKSRISRIVPLPENL